MTPWQQSWSCCTETCTLWALLGCPQASWGLPVDYPMVHTWAETSHGLVPWHTNQEGWGRLLDREELVKFMSDLKISKTQQSEPDDGEVRQ